MSDGKREPVGNGTKRILFVDDEPNVLAGLRNVLRPQRHEWEMVFALGPEEALARIAERPFDVVVSDMRMPQMDGATLLARVKQVQPQAVRLILTGQTEQESVMKSVFVAHMFLSKPCDPALLRQVVTRACRLSAILNSEDLRIAAGGVEMLPAAPKTYVALNEALIRPNCSARDLGHIIERDVGLCAKILQLVNSAFFGLPTKTVSLEQAITYIGTQTIRNLTLALEAFAVGSRSCGLTPSELTALQTHSLVAARVARQLHAGKTDRSEEAFLAGVLHEVGWLVCVDEKDLADRRITVDRALLGAYLLGLWGLPHAITEAVAYHREPQLLPHDAFELVDEVYLAHHLAAQCLGEKSAKEIDLEYLARMGITSERVEQLRTMANELATAGT